MHRAGFPALYRYADAASENKQRRFLLLVGIEYGLLILAAILSMSYVEKLFIGDYSVDRSFFYIVYAAVFIISIVVLLRRAVLQPHRKWYECRALAESVKTLTWRYMMRAEPFSNASETELPREAFRKQLHQLFSVDPAMARIISYDWSADDQITKEMDDVRALTLEQRKARYGVERIYDQQQWYANKAKYNRQHANIWVWIGLACYVVAVGLVLGRIFAVPGSLLDRVWPIEPVIVLASSFIGWTQIKKFDELGAAYTLTAREVGLIGGKLDRVRTETELSDFVNEAEQAFSREHTMWIARQGASHRPASGYGQ